MTSTNPLLSSRPPPRLRPQTPGPEGVKGAVFRYPSGVRALGWALQHANPRHDLAKTTEEVVEMLTNSSISLEDPAEAPTWLAFFASRAADGFRGPLVAPDIFVVSSDGQLLRGPGLRAPRGVFWGGLDPSSRDAGTVPEGSSANLAALLGLPAAPGSPVFTLRHHARDGHAGYFTVDGQALGGLGGAGGGFSDMLRFMRVSPTLSMAQYDERERRAREQRELQRAQRPGPGPFSKQEKQARRDLLRAAGRADLRRRLRRAGVFGLLVERGRIDAGFGLPPPPEEPSFAGEFEDADRDRSDWLQRLRERRSRRVGRSGYA